MMPHLSQIYDAAFFKEWGPAHETYVSSASIIAAVLFEAYRPKRLVDIGCGCGVYSHLFKEKGVEVLSIDGVQPPSEHAYPVSIHRQDITVPFENTWGNFDLALCLEVAEHIPEELIDPFLANITRFSDRLVLSAAQPNQGGHHHVNEQPKRYWVQRLAQLGFIYARSETGRLMEAFKTNKPGYMWMSEQISVYNKTAADKIDWNGIPTFGKKEFEIKV